MTALGGLRTKCLSCERGCMREPYEPVSDFLKAVVADKVPLAGSAVAEANLQRLIALTRDEDRSNRDWATMLLAQDEVDTPEVREALLAAAHDEDDIVRAEAIAGLARRDRAVALSLVHEALSGDSASLPLFEAAELLAHPSLVQPLQDWIEPSIDKFLDNAARDALLACERGEPTA